jgi:hypothetical protein
MVGGGMRGRGQKCFKNLVGNPEGKRLLGNLRRIILKCLVRKEIMIGLD